MGIVRKENRQERKKSTLRRERRHPCLHEREARRKVLSIKTNLEIKKHFFSLLRKLCGQTVLRSQHRAISFLCSFFLCMFFVSCSVNEPKPVPNTNVTNQNTNPPVAVSHGSPTQTSNGNSQDKGTRRGGTPIDTSKFDADIKKAEDKFNKNKTDNAAKMSLAQAYLDRADALTEAAQYASALGDYRRVLKLTPDNEDAARSSNEIIRIYLSLKREPPKEGEEPPPLPYKN